MNDDMLDAMTYGLDLSASGDATIVWGPSALKSYSAAVLPPGVTVKYGGTHKITGTYKASVSFSVPMFKYGDIVHIKNAPSQREMVITVEKHYINTIVLDREEPGIFGVSSGMSIESAVRVTE